VIAKAGVRRDPRSAVALTITLLLVVAIEVLYLDNFWRSNEENRRIDDQVEAINAQTQRHIAELHSTAQKIGVIFTRLNEGIERVPTTEGRLPTPAQEPKSNSSPASDSRVAGPLREYGLEVTSQDLRESSLSFQAGSNHLELHRLVPLLAELENSNAFLFVDKIDLVRPLRIPAFSTSPTELETKFSMRVLAGPK
jgi:hypothetical protein